LSVPGKVYACVILCIIRGHLQRCRHKEQSAFTPHRSTTDCIATLRMILQTRREFRRLRVALSLSTDNLSSYCSSIKGVPQKLTELLQDLSTNTISCVESMATCRTDAPTRTSKKTFDDKCIHLDTISQRGGLTVRQKW